MTFTAPRFMGNVRLMAAAANSPTMKFGESGPDVALVQQSLLELEYPFFDSIKSDGHMDGKFGPETREVVKEFQRSLPNSVDDDGIIGHDTMTKLDRAVAAGIKTRPKGDVKMKRLVTSALGGHELLRLNINRLGFRLNHHELAKVAGAVIDDRIQVLHDPSLKASDAAYDSITDSFHFGFTQSVTHTRKALIAHEAVHAAMDMQSVAGLLKKQSEAIAWVAQMYFNYQHTLNPKENQLTADNDLYGDNRVYELSWRIADMMHDGITVKEIDWIALEESFQFHSEYAGTTGEICKFNGLKEVA